LQQRQKEAKAKEKQRLLYLKLVHKINKVILKSISLFNKPLDSNSLPKGGLSQRDLARL